MDIAYFISDLLGQQGELSVPNLGYFVQMRMSAYYNEQEQKFYPPRYAVQFDPQVIDDDDSLATHISQKKNISLASAKYFIEKYISGLKAEALSNDVPFGGIGSFKANGVQLVFKPEQKATDAAFFAFEPISVYKTGPVPVAAPLAQAEEATIAIQTPPVPPIADIPTTETALPQEFPVQEEEPLAADEETYEEFTDDGNRSKVWIIVALVLVLLIAAGAAVYKFKPELLDKLITHKTPAAPAKSNPLPLNLKDTTIKKQADIPADTAKRTPADTAGATISPGKNISQTTVTRPTVKPENKTTDVKPAVIAPVNTAPATGITDAVKGTWVIRSQAFPTRAGADARIDLLKGKGFSQARLENANVKRGGNYKVILGVYTTRKEAMDAATELLGTNKITRSELSVEQIK